MGDCFCIVFANVHLRNKSIECRPKRHFKDSFTHQEHLMQHTWSLHVAPMADCFCIVFARVHLRNRNIECHLNDPDKWPQRPTVFASSLLMYISVLTSSNGSNTCSSISSNSSNTRSIENMGRERENGGRKNMTCTHLQNSAKQSTDIYSKCMTKYRCYRKPEAPYDSEASRGAGSSRSIDFDLLCHTFTIATTLGQKVSELMTFW